MKKFTEWLQENDLDLDLDLDVDSDDLNNKIKSNQVQKEPIQSKISNGMIEINYQSPNVKGYLHAQKDENNPNIYRVIRVTVNPQGKGYGKNLYLSAIELATKNGLMLSPAKNSTSDSAMNVWRSLYLNNNIKKTNLTPSDWPDSPRNHNMMKKYPNLRYKDPETYPPKNDIEFWTFNSAYNK